MSNKNYIELDDNSYFDVERAISKIAKENGITDVESIEVSLTPDKGILQFKQSKIKGCKEDKDKDKGKDKDKDDEE